MGPTSLWAKCQGHLYEEYVVTIFGEHNLPQVSGELMGEEEGGGLQTEGGLMPRPWGREYLAQY
jgi:hypothetical protein